jgi:hypothetical protein
MNLSKPYIPKDRNYWHKVIWGLYVMLKVAGFSDSYLLQLATDGIKNFDSDGLDPKVDEIRLQIYYGIIRLTSKI